MVARQRSFRALVIGCGSIGRRHINNLVKLDKIDSVFLYTKVKNCLDFLDNKRGKLSIIKNLDDIKVDFALICNETSRHIETASFLSQKGMDLFIEKPLSHNLKNIKRLQDVVNKRKINVFVGYNLRFLGAVNYVKQLLKKNTIGDLYFSQIEAGQYLPHWRNNIDYRDCYSAKKDRGGGVSLDLSHEVDYMRYLFGDPIVKRTMKTKVSMLDIDSDDLFEGLYFFKNRFICSIHLDYLQMEKRRMMRIVGSRGIIECDFNRKEIKIKRNGNNESVIRDKDLFDIDKSYDEELKHFINVVEKRSKPAITLEDGIKILKLLGE